MNNDFQTFLESIKPNNEFNPELLPQSPNYAKSDSWLALPSKPSFHNLSPYTYESSARYDVDVFYIHPTGYFGTEWNANLDPDSAWAERSSTHLATQGSAFSKYAHFYAPEYRQATYYSFFDLSESPKHAQDLAYSDIERAFEYYLENYNQGKKFIIASHSQGSLHAQRLIYNKVCKNNLQSKLIAAYLIGYIIPTKHFEVLFPGLKISNSVAGQQEIISWCSGIEGFRRVRAHNMYWLPTGWIREDMEQDLICTNPLAWRLDKDWHINDIDNAVQLTSTSPTLTNFYATKNAYPKLGLRYTRSQIYSARVSDTSLLEMRGELVDHLVKYTRNGDLHSFDITLFWQAIENNVLERIRAS
ncbi:MAG: DUF3089 domain-containing protein [Gammaproteobacteria bacterium]